MRDARWGMGMGDMSLCKIPGLMAVVLLGMSMSVYGDLPSTIDKIRGSIVGVGTMIPTRRSQSGAAPVQLRGTGFVVGNGRHIITNYHVIPEKLDDLSNQQLVVFVGRGKNSTMRTVKLIKSDPVHDLALLELKDGRPLPAMKLASKKYKVLEGQNIAFTGFPIGAVLGLQPTTHRGIISVITPIVLPQFSANTITAVQMMRMRQPFDIYQLDATAYPGNSGSPVFDVESGAVIGVINSVVIKESKETILEKPSGISYAIPVEHVANLLKNL
jgi:serine protease Do